MEYNFKLKSPMVQRWNIEDLLCCRMGYMGVVLCIEITVNDRLTAHCFVQNL